MHFLKGVEGETLAVVGYQLLGLRTMCKVQGKADFKKQINNSLSQYGTGAKMLGLEEGKTGSNPPSLLSRETPWVAFARVSNASFASVCSEAKRWHSESSEKGQDTCLTNKMILFFLAESLLRGGVALEKNSQQNIIGLERKLIPPPSFLLTTLY